MEQWIKDRINRVESLEDRRVLRDAILGALVGIDEYNKTLYADLEERLSQELADYRLEFNVYTAVCARDEYDPINDFLFPMIESDLQPYQDLDQKTLIQQVHDGYEVPITTLFLNCETEKINKLLAEKRVFSGILYGDDGKHAVTLRLQECQRYKNKLAYLYHSFLFNDIAWKTLHAPYMQKFVDVIVVDIDESQLEGNGHIENIEIDLGEYEPYKLEDRIPLWNIRKLETKPTFFPMPAYDTIHYEHTISMENLGKLDNYIVSHDNDDVVYVKRNRDELVVVTREDRVRDWMLYAIHSPREDSLSWITEPIFSNARIKSFSERYAATLSLTIRTKGEIKRLLNSFVAFSAWELEDVVMMRQRIAWDWNESHDVNFFVMDHVRNVEEKPMIELLFSYKDDKTYLTQDTMDFFVSEVQLAFPDYACVGKWA